MKLKINREHCKSNYTIGDLYINYEDGSGYNFYCNTMEDRVRDLNKDGDLNDKGEGKVFKETAIPYGTYYLELSFSTKYKKIMPRILNVKGFDGILIHPGNTAEDSWGCILIGDNTEQGMVTNSINTFKKLMLLFEKNKQEKYELIIE